MIDLDNSASAVSLVNGQETARRVAPTNAFTPWQTADLEQNVPTRFEQQVAQHAGRPAVQYGTEVLTYAELNQKANRLAHAILAARGPAAEPVVIMLEQSISLIVAILAVLKAGKFYVAVDPASPAGRTAPILVDTAAPLLLTNHKNLWTAVALVPPSCQLLNVEELDPTLPTTNPGLPIPPDAYLNIRYTSGSTGQPKGVLDSHRAVLHMAMVSTNRLHLCPDDRLALVFSATFSAASGNTFGALLNGAALVLFDLKKQGVAQLAQWLATEQITVFHSVTTIFRQMMSLLKGDEQFPALRLVKVGSEPVLRRDFELYRQHCPDSCLFHLTMATTETHVVAWNLLDKESEVSGAVVPVGYAEAGKEILILDEGGRPLSPNQMGEIVVRSHHHSPGYWQKPDETCKAFRPAPDGDGQLYYTGDLGILRPDGCLEHLGRKDFQVKIRGYRVNAAEVEMALLEVAGVGEAAVAAHPGPAGDPRLVAYIVPAGPPAPTPAELRHALAATLPDYAVPAHFITLEALPLLPFGKVNRRALLLPDWSLRTIETTFTAPRTPLEEMLASLWSAALGVQQIGVHDNFFELGGHSLLAAQILAGLSEQHQSAISPQTFLERPTIAELAAVIEQGAMEAMTPEAVQDALRLLGSF